MPAAPPDPANEIRARLLQAWANGEPALFQDGETVQAQLLRDVLLHRLDQQKDWEPDPRGLVVKGAAIAGFLDLSHAQLAGPLELSNCQLPDGGTLEGATVPGDLDLANSSIAHLDLDQAHIKGYLIILATEFTGMRPGSHGYSLTAQHIRVDSSVAGQQMMAAGAVRFVAAQISGGLDLIGAHLRGVDSAGWSLHAQRADVGGGVSLQDGFQAAGGVSLSGARVAGQLTAAKTQLGASTDRCSLNAQSASVGGGMYFRDECSTSGAVHLSGAHVSSLQMSGTSLGSDGDGCSLNAQGLRADRGVFLGGGFTSVGSISLAAARITGQVGMVGAHLGADGDGRSLNAQIVEINGSIALQGKFRTDGAVSLPGARITGQLDMTGALLGRNHDGESLFAENMQVGAGALLGGGLAASGKVSLRGARVTGRLLVGLQWLDVLGDLQLALDLDHVRTDRLDLDLKEVSVDEPCLTNRLVSLDHCTYDSRPDEKFGSLDQWLRLLASGTPGYQARAYQQLASVHRATGHDRDAGTVLMQQQDHRRRTVLRAQRGDSLRQRMALWSTRSGLGVSKAVLGYGHRPVRAALALLALVTVAMMTAFMAAHTWEIPPDVPVARRPAYTPPGGSPVGPAECSVGETVGLGLRMAVPLVNNLAQGACALDTSSSVGGFFGVLSFVWQFAAWVLGALVLAAAAKAWRRPA